MKNIAIFLYSQSKTIAQPWADAGVECHLFDLYEREDSKNIFHHSGDIRASRKKLGELCRNNNCILIGSFTPCTDMSVAGARHFEKKCLNDAMFWAKAMELALIGIDLAAFFNVPYFIENPRTVLGTLMDRKHDHVFHPWQFGGYLPENHQHRLYPEVYPGQDAYSKETWLWTGNGLIMPEKKGVQTVSKDYLGWSRLFGKSERTKRIGSVTPEGFSLALFHANCNKISNQ